MFPLSKPVDHELQIYSEDIEYHSSQITLPSLITRNYDDVSVSSRDISIAREEVITRNKDDISMSYEKYEEF